MASARLCEPACFLRVFESVLRERDLDVTAMR